ncbi:MAG: hypothetical protein JST00_32235 [Deltaproteobacteria bacterium]|nr:hypothetical protein [Deltaproteobacteria bacterium]
MRLRATLKHVSGDARNVSVMVGRGGVAKMPDPVALRIVPDGAGYSLLRIDAGGMSVSHTWHPSLDAAKAKGSADYGISASDWEEEPTSPRPPPTSSR